ncbi:hypothetical protein LEP1GSC186_1242 [Leptospira noguchii serovar Autumnalis str. ZUN142]|uniref:Uncharacterized protein n=1 Tax=Leptospira noguchii serovar Autumnalis str. ZUN142 TaxID=1085540 RepID=M6U8Y6_9LEPT|nr:hypothetical protein LEP1GSC186_1242 [Leptospira noguchii serovar Autumnalis str. ZUN142]
METQHNAHYGSRWKLNTTLSMDRVGNSTQRSLWIALETQHNALYGSRCGLKNAHFSSVPTGMSLFTCKKYVFLIEKNLPNFSTFRPHPKRGKTQQNALYGSRSRMGTQFYRGFVVIPTDLILRSKYLWGWL